MAPGPATRNLALAGPGCKSQSHTFDRTPGRLFKLKADWISPRRRPSEACEFSKILQQNTSRCAVSWADNIRAPARTAVKVRPLGNIGDFTCRGEKGGQDTDDRLLMIEKGKSDSSCSHQLSIIHNQFSGGGFLSTWPALGAERCCASGLRVGGGGDDEGIRAISVVARRIRAGMRPASTRERKPL